MNTITISDVIQRGNRIDYIYQIDGAWQSYFCREQPFFVEYSQNIEAVPKSLAVIPLIGNLIVMASLMDARIYLEEIDRDFYECIPEFLSGYASLSPQVTFQKEGRIIPQRIVESPRDSVCREDLLFFSGGIDAWSSLVTHLEEKPALLSIWGADIAWDNQAAWEKTRKLNQDVAQHFALPFLTIRANLHTFRYESRLNEFSYPLVSDNWWSAFQHSVGMMSLAAPLGAGKCKNLWFGSTYCSRDREEWGSYVTASDPKIDNHVRFGGCQVCHDGYEFSRLEKTERICRYFRGSGYTPFLRCCYLSTSGENCGTCEKCANTIMGILLAGYDPRDYGFPYDEETFPGYFAAGVQEMAKEEKYALLSFYWYLQQAYRQKYKLEQVPPVLRAFYLTDLEILADFLHVPCNKCTAHKASLEYLEEVVIGKRWLENQYNLLSKDNAELRDWCAKLEDGKRWLEEQYHYAQEQASQARTQYQSAVEQVALLEAQCRSYQEKEAASASDQRKKGGLLSKIAARF